MPSLMLMVVLAVEMDTSGDGQCSSFGGSGNGLGTRVSVNGTAWGEHLP